MSLLRSLLLDKKIFDAHEEIDEFLEANDIEDGSLINEIKFDGSVFEDKDQVSDFLVAHFLDNSNIDDSGKGFSVVLFDRIGFVESTLKEVKLRDGIIIVVGIIKPMAADNPLLFSEGKNFKLSSDHPYMIELARTVKGFHMNFGEVEITKSDLISFKNNFENNVVGVDLSIDFDHETREAAGWIREVFLSEDGEVLLGGVMWTPKGALALSDREFRYLSPEFNPNWVHPHTGVLHGPTLLGAALVNRPFLKMDAIVSLKDKNQGDIVETIKLSEHNTKVADLENKISTLALSEVTAKNTIGQMKIENESLSGELKTLKTEVEKKEKEDEFKILFSDGKINKAQHDALIGGKSMLEVLTLSEKMNTKPAGSSQGGNKDAVTLDDGEARTAKAFGQTPEEFRKYNPVMEA